MTQKAEPGRVEIVRHLFDRTDNRSGGLTVFARHTKGDSFIEVSTSPCSHLDLYNRKIGYKIAKENLEAGKLIRVPLNQFQRKSITRDQLLYAVDGLFAYYLYR